MSQDKIYQSEDFNKPDEVTFTPPAPKTVEEVVNPDFTEAERREILLPANESALLINGFLQLIQDEKGQRLFKKVLAQARISKVRPANWSKAANAPYYRQQYAEELRPVIDQMLKDGRDKIFLYSRYHTISARSLYQKILQAFLFLTNELDTPELTYFQAREKIMLVREDNGVRLTFGGNSQPINMAEDAMSTEIRYKWKEDLDVFLEQGLPGTKFELDKLQLRDDQVRELDESLAPLAGIVYSISSAEIKVLKLAL